MAKKMGTKKMTAKGSPKGNVIAIGNQKGGVGKTTNAVHIAAALGSMGERCLILDLDPAAGATKHLGIPVDSYTGSLELLTTDETVEALAVTEAMPEGVHLIPSRPQLVEIDTQLSKYVDKTRILERPLAEAKAKYDFIFLDTGPSPGFTTTVAAYSSSDWFLLSAFPHPLSMGGLTEAFNDIADARKHRNPRLEVLGVVFSAVDGRAKILRAKLVDVVNRALPNRAFSTIISQAIALPEASGEGKTIFQIEGGRRSQVGRQYALLAEELAYRVNNRDAFLQGTLAPFVAPRVASTEPLNEEADIKIVVNG